MMKQPDAKKHLQISLLKSAVRVSAGTCLMFGAAISTGVLLIVAELLGILEELV